jgi:hypothetical protein
MRTQLIAALAAVTLCAPGTAAAQTTPTSRPAAPALTGTWTSAPHETPLSTDFDRSVWGPGARSVRDVRMTIDASGQGTLTVTKRVLDQRGRTVAGSTSIEEARLTVGGLQEPSTSPRAEYAVTVASAERRYPDDKEYKWPIDGLKVRIATVDEGGDGTIEIRFDTPEGRGSFWETLRRQGRRAAPRR